MHSHDKTVSFDGHSLRLDTAEDAEEICEKMREVGSALEILILQGNSFGIEAAERIGHELARHPNLREAHFKDLFTTRGKEQVPPALDSLLGGIISSGAKLTLLDLSDNAIGPIGAPSVLRFLSSSSADSLEKLYVNNCGWGPEGSTSLSTVLGRLVNLKEFICGRSRLENKGATNISDALMKLNGLEVLMLNQNGINVPGISELVKVLIKNAETLRVLDLSDNTIKPEGCELLFKPISKSKNLRKLILADALLQNPGCSIICDALSRSESLRKLECLNLEGNEIKGNKIIDLIEMTFSNCRENFVLDLLDNEFTRDQRQRIKCIGNGDYLIDSASDSEYEDDEDDQSDADNEDNREEGEITSETDENSDGYVNLGDGEFRERVEDFMNESKKSHRDEQKLKALFLEMISIGRSSNAEANYQAAQILCEELGLIKCESTRKKKPVCKESLVYIAKNRVELPKQFGDFLECASNNSDDITCAKLLFRL